MIKTLYIRIKDKHSQVLVALAREVNLVWNYCNELSYTHLRRTGKFFSGYDLQKFTVGATKEGLSLSAASIQMVGHELVRKRKQFKKTKLKWRTSFGSRRSLGWIPFKSASIRYQNGQLHYAGHHLGLWDSYGLSGYELGSGCFSQDARGRWYVSICVEIESTVTTATAAVGIDLGLKDLAVTSAGERIEVQQLYRKAEPKIVAAQRARKKTRVRALHAQVKNRRHDHLHKISTRLVRQHAAIFVGNVSAVKLGKTSMAKSVYDAGWSTLRGILRYKCEHAGAFFAEVDEAYSTQTCNGCSGRTGPKGREGLGIRGWTCTECGVDHDRDVNAARNILAKGHLRLAGGSP